MLFCAIFLLPLLLLLLSSSTTLKEWKTPDFRNTPSTTNLEEEEIVDAPGKDGNASMPEQVKRPNPWKKMMMMMTIGGIPLFYEGISKIFRNGAATYTAVVVVRSTGRW
jgi:hypothetical protein